MKKENNEVVTAHDLAKKQREISVSEFFAKNRHLLGFDNPIRALLMTVKEAVDNSLDACQDIHILPEIIVEIKRTQGNETRFTVIVEDNGPGILNSQIPKIFGQLLYGSKFHYLKQNRGQQGIGISASVLYSQLTTGNAAKITSKVLNDKKASFFEITINTKSNEPKVIKEEEIIWENKKHGTKVEIQIEARYIKGKQSVDEYLKQTAIVNPHAYIIYTTPDNEKIEFPRVTNEVPAEPRTIKPHPYGIELGVLIKMLRDTTARTLQSFLQNDFCRIGNNTAKEICDKANIPANTKPAKIALEDVEKLLKAMHETKIIAPPTDCVSPITEELILKGLKKEFNAEFYGATTRAPSVYRGMPFQIEAAIAYGGELPADAPVRILRFANRVPLLYQQGACGITEAITETNWRAYGLQQSTGSIPQGPVIILVHFASVWAPFTSESKDALAHYPEIIKEIKLALQEVGRKLDLHIRHTVKAREQIEKINLFEKYIPEVASALHNLSGEPKENIVEGLNRILKKGLPDLKKEVDKIEESKD